MSFENRRLDLYGLTRERLDELVSDIDSMWSAQRRQIEGVLAHLGRMEEEGRHEVEHRVRMAVISEEVDYALWVWRDSSHDYLRRKAIARRRAMRMFPGPWRWFWRMLPRALVGRRSMASRYNR